MEKLLLISIRSLSSRPAGTRGRILGKILETHVFRTKDDDDMAIIKVADETGSMEVFVFPDVYHLTSAQLIKGMMITVQGRTFLDPGNDIKMVGEVLV